MFPNFYIFASMIVIKLKDSPKDGCDCFKMCEFIFFGLLQFKNHMCCSMEVYNFYSNMKYVLGWKSTDSLDICAFIDCSKL